MTRVILTNKQTGQELPEAELASESSTTLAIQFDGAARHNVFSRNEWDYREVRAFRNGDVLRRKDRDDTYGFYVYTDEGWGYVNWGKSGPTLAPREEPSSCYLNNPEWELV